MSKAILVIEKPNSCNECPLFCGHYSDMFCRGNNRTIDYPYPKDFVQDWCPLKQIAKRNEGLYQLDYSQGYMRGWNACLDKILGE